MYFSERDGNRGLLIVVDVADASRVPTLAEPFFLMFDASVKFRICMTPEDLAGPGWTSWARSTRSSHRRFERQCRFVGCRPIIPQVGQEVVAHGA